MPGGNHAAGSYSDAPVCNQRGRSKDCCRAGVITAGDVPAAATAASQLNVAAPDVTAPIQTNGRAGQVDITVIIDRSIAINRLRQ